MGLFSSQFIQRIATNVGANQGLCTDGTDFWTSALDNDSFTLSHYDSSWVLTGSPSTRDVSADLPVGATQINSLDMVSGVIVAGCNNHPTLPKKGWLVEFNATTLAHIATHDTLAVHSEGAAYRSGSNEWFDVNLNTSNTDRYNSSFVRQETHALGYAIDDTEKWYQGARWLSDDYFLANLKESTVWPHTCDIYKYEGGTFTNACRMLQPTHEGDGVANCGQGLEIDPNGDFILWAERDNAVTHDVVQSSFNKTPNPVQTVYTDAMLALDNLLFYHQMRETTGTTLADASGNNRDLTLQGGKDLTTRGDISGFTTEADGRGVFLSESDYLSMSHESALSFGDGESFSFGMWVYVHRIIPNHYTYSKGIGGETAPNNHNYGLILDWQSSGTIDFFIEEADGTNHIAASTTSMEAGKAYFVVCVRDGPADEMKIYINGTLETTNTDVFTPNTNVQDVVFNGLSDGSNLKETAIFEPFMTSDIVTAEEVTTLWDASQFLPEVVTTGVEISGQHAIPTLRTGGFDKPEPRKRMCNIIIDGQIVRTVPCEGTGKIMRKDKPIHMTSNITRTVEVSMLGRISYKFTSLLEAKVLRKKRGTISADIPIAENIHDILQNNLKESKIKKIKQMWKEYKRQ